MVNKGLMRIDNNTDCRSYCNSVVLDINGVFFLQNDSVSLDKFTWDTFLNFYNRLTCRLEVEKVFCEM